MKNDCMKCKHGVLLTGGYTHNKYIECAFEREFIEKATLEELMRAVPGQFCTFEKGKPVDGGITFDD